MSDHEAANRLTDLEAVATAARLSRLRQKEFYRDRTRARMLDAQRAEKELDNALAALDGTGAGMRPLFPYGPITAATHGKQDVAGFFERAAADTGPTR